MGITPAKWNCLALSNSLIGHCTRFLFSPWEAKSIKWQSRRGNKWAPYLHFLSGRLYLPWPGSVCYLCEIVLSHGVQPHLHLWLKLKELGSNLLILHRLCFLTSKNVQHLAFKFLSKPEQGQALTDPTKYNLLANTYVSVRNKANCNQMRISTCVEWAPRQENKGMVLERCHPVWRDR